VWSAKRTILEKPYHWISVNYLLLLIFPVIFNLLLIQTYYGLNEWGNWNCSGLEILPFFVRRCCIFLICLDWKPWFLVLALFFMRWRFILEVRVIFLFQVELPELQQITMQMNSGYMLRTIILTRIIKERRMMERIAQIECIYHRITWERCIAF